MSQQQHQQIKDSIERIKAQRTRWSNLSKLCEAIKLGDRQALSFAITLCESALASDQKQASEVLNNVLHFTGKSRRIGITGVPGVGKSTFIESYGTMLANQGQKVAVLAVDPSSSRSGGSILGDKTRMEQLSVHPNAFVRPSPSRGGLGGVARASREALLLCEAAGFDTVIIETVGVGQSEVTVHGMVDFFLLLMLSGAGDELQGIKRGIMEMAHALVITKADGDNIHQAKQARLTYQNAMHLLGSDEFGWNAPALSCSAINQTGIEEVEQAIAQYYEFMNANNKISIRRTNQSVSWFREHLENRFLEFLNNKPDIRAQIDALEENIRKNTISPFAAADEVLKSISF